MTTTEVIRANNEEQNRVFALRAAMAGHFNGRYWADRAVADLYEKTGVRLVVRQDKYSCACTLEIS